MPGYMDQGAFLGGVGVPIEASRLNDGVDCRELMRGNPRGRKIAREILGRAQASWQVVESKGQLTDEDDGLNG